MLGQIFLQRLGVDLGDGDAVRRAAGCAFALATQALNELPMLQFPPSLSAAAILVAARKAQVSASQGDVENNTQLLRLCSLPKLKHA